MRRLFHQLLNFSLALSLILAPLTEARAAVPGGRIDVASYGVTADLPSGAEYEYLEELAARPDTTVQPIVLLDYAHYDKTTQISPAAMALLSIAVGQFVGGLNFIQGIESVFWQSAAKAGLSSVITQSVAGVVSGEFDIGEILEGAAFAGLSAGLTAGINADDLGITLGDGAKLSLLGTGDNFTLAALVEGTIDAGIKAGLTSAVYGSDFGDAFLDSLSATVSSALLADVQTLIGDQGLAEGSSGHAFLHGLAGCAFAEVSEGDCAAGFAAGVAQSLYAGTLEGADPEAALNTAELVGAFAGFVFSGGEAQNVGLAAQIAELGFKNNYLTHSDLVMFERELMACIETGSSCEEVISRYQQLSLKHNAELAACGDDLACIEQHVVNIVVGDVAHIFARVKSLIAQVDADDPVALAQAFEVLQYDANAAAFSQVDMPTVYMKAGAQYRQNFTEMSCQGLSTGECNLAFNEEVSRLGALAAQQADADAAQAASLLLAGMGIIVDLTPIVGDIKGFVECGSDLSIATCLGAVAGLVPLLGDGAKLLMKRGDEIFETGSDAARPLFTGGRTLDRLNPEDWDLAEAAYVAIRASDDDIAAIAANTGISPGAIRRAKEHLFLNEHALDDGIRRFDADPEIANAWKRLESGDYRPEDIDLINHERFESILMGRYGQPYRCAHLTANACGYQSPIE